MRRMLVICLAVAVAPGPAFAQERSTELVVQDPAGDANALNDQLAGRYAGDVETSQGSVDEADLRSLRVRSLHQDGKPVGLSFLFTTTEPLAEHRPSGQDVDLWLQVNLDGDCMFTIRVPTSDGQVGEATLTPGFCTGVGTKKLRAVQNGKEVRVDAKYGELPPEVTPGRRAQQLTLATRLLTPQGLTVGTFDNQYVTSVTLP